MHDRGRTARVVLRAVAIAWLLFFWVWLNGTQATFVEVDAEAYWGFRLSELYTGTQLGDQDAFLYSPAVALLFAPFSALPYEVFYGLLAAVNLGALVWLVGWELAAVLLFVPFVSNEIARGNIHLLLAAAIVLGMRRPAAWAWVLLTKVTPGVGLLWFALQRRWRSLAVALGVTALVAAGTFVFVPGLWVRWIEMLAGNAGSTRPSLFEIPVIPRMVIAAGLLVLGAWRGRPAIVPVAAMIALPAIWVNSLAMLVAVIPLWRTRDD